MGAGGWLVLCGCWGGGSVVWVLGRWLVVLCAGVVRCVVGLKEGVMTVGEGVAEPIIICSKEGE